MLALFYLSRPGVPWFCCRSNISGQVHNCLKTRRDACVHDVAINTSNSSSISMSMTMSMRMKRISLGTGTLLRISGSVTGCFAPHALLWDFCTRKPLLRFQSINTQKRISGRERMRMHPVCSDLEKERERDRETIDERQPLRLT